MPNKNIESAILKGTGQLEGVSYEEITFEGYGREGLQYLLNV
jgi:transcriptional/translational regulatory protein YebC/TACO1